MAPRIFGGRPRAHVHADDCPPGRKVAIVTKLTYAVDRLFDTGWTPATDVDLDRLPDGRAFPSVPAVQREFARAGFQLSIKQNLVFNCFRSTWGPAGDGLGASISADPRHGTVIGDCEREAAVYALAQFRETQAERHVAHA
jgi:hypothetical protein